MRVREDLGRLSTGGVDEGTNIISTLVDTVTWLIVQELLEAEQTDYLGGGAAMNEGRGPRRVAQRL